MLIIIFVLFISYFVIFRILEIRCNVVGIDWAESISLESGFHDIEGTPSLSSTSRGKRKGYGK